MVEYFVSRTISTSDMVEFELCSASPEAIQVAKEYGFNRIELCANLEMGGTTPSHAMIDAAVASGVETHVLIRPRPGDFVYSLGEKAMILEDIRHCLRVGVAGVVIGALTDDGQVDEAFLKEMMDAANGLHVSFHRAIDDCVDWKAALDVVISVGVHRVLTSGMAAKVDVEVLQEMVQYAKRRISIMAGGGVSTQNVKSLLDAGCNAVHFSGTVERAPASSKSLFGCPLLIVNRSKVEAIMQAAKTSQ
ncbi:unnamed protein product [Aphanomyces euteiches]